MKPKQSRKIPEMQLRRPGSRWRWWWQVMRRLGLGVAALGLLMLVLVLWVYDGLAARYDLTELGKMPERTVVLDRRGEELGRLYGEERVVVPLSAVSPWFVKALLVREDRRFYLHHGVDWSGMVRATLRNVRELRVVQGASTLTMQLARNSYPELDERTFHRKLVEVMLARRIEAAVGKDQILEHYVNRIYFGSGLWGIQRASEVYFGKHAAQLGLSEAAMLAGIIRSPSRFSPFRNLEGATRERDVVLKRLVQLGVITPEQELAARYDDVVLRAQRLVMSQGHYGLDLVKAELDEILVSQDLREGGLQVETTLDGRLDAVVAQVVERRLAEVERGAGYRHLTRASYVAQQLGLRSVVETPYLQAAVTVLDNETGALLAVAGGRDYQHSRFNRATAGARQLGSLVKPFVYAAGLEAGLLPGDLVEDLPLREGEIDGAQVDWQPMNADRQFLGAVPMQIGLVQSRNLMSVRVGQAAGLERVTGLLTEVGLGRRLVASPQMFIGNVASNSRLVAGAYSVFPNHGELRQMHLIARITDKRGQVIFESRPQVKTVMRPGVAALLRRLLGQAVDEGTGVELRRGLNFKGAAWGKTGTTNDYKDAWFAGFTDRLTASVWVGLDQAAKIAEGAYGSKVAMPIWADVMREAVALGYEGGAEVERVPQLQVRLCRAGGGLAADACVAAGGSYVDTLPYELVPGHFCEVHGDGRAGGKVAQEGPGIWERVKGVFSGR